MLVRGQQLPGAIPPLERYLEPLREQAGIPGMSGAVVQNGEIILGSGLRLSGRRSQNRSNTRHAVSCSGPQPDAGGDSRAAMRRAAPHVSRRAGHPLRDVTARAGGHAETRADVTPPPTLPARRSGTARAVPAADVSSGVVRTTAVPKERRASHSQSARDERFRARHRPEGSVRRAGQTCSIRPTWIDINRSSSAWPFPTEWTTADGPSEASSRQRA